MFDQCFMKGLKSSKTCRSGVDVMSLGLRSFAIYNNSERENETAY